MHEYLSCLFCFFSTHASHVFHRPEFEPIAAAKKPVKSKKAKAEANPEAVQPVDETKFLGCVGSESQFIDKVYNGGSTGANYNLALHHAKTSRKKYFAVARGGGDGHAFAFSQLDTSKAGLISGGGKHRHLYYLLEQLF